MYLCKAGFFMYFNNNSMSQPMKAKADVKTPLSFIKLEINRDFQKYKKTMSIFSLNILVNDCFIKTHALC
jgi:hypothetical protein